MRTEDLLDRLDPEQRRAVASPAPLLAVIAGAGSGKTTVLARRIAYRVATDTADARHVLALTFTRQAAVELRGRLRGVGVRDDVTAGTFHAIGLGIMRQRWADTRRPAPNVIGDRRRLVGEAIGAEQVRGEAAEIAAEIDWARARLVSPADYAAAARRSRRRTRTDAARVADTYEAVETLKRRRGVVDLDDLLANVLDAVRRDPAFADALRWRFRHLFVDEAQDLNPLQVAVLDVLRHGRDDLTLVGDPYQAIFGFNGADPGLLLEVEQRFPGIEVIRLDTNYRCTPEIVAAGVAVLGDADRLASGRVEGAPVTARHFENADVEAAFVADQVRRWGAPWRRIAVLARTNAQLATLGRALEQRGIPTSTSGSDLRGAISDAVGQRDAQHLQAWARDALTPVADDVAPRPDRDEPARTVALAVLEYLDEERSGDGRGFGDWVRANRPFDTRRHDSVDLLTFHGAKGREWPRVVVTGVETGLVPHRASTAGAARAEESRLLYVAITRGGDEVLITSAASRAGRAAKPSPFLGDLPEPPALMAPPTRLRTALAPVDPVLERLDAWRSSAARAAGVSPAVVCTDRVLAAIADARPTTTDELAEVAGVGVLMARRFGPRILAAMTASV